MNKICLIYCYSDRNRGDLGIILGTIHLIKKKYPDSIINVISTYESNDSNFINDHKELSKHVDKIYPSIIGRFNKNDKRNYLKFITDIFLILAAFIRLKSLIKFFLSKKQKKVLEIISEADFVISKGGSYLCNTSRFVDKIRFFRLLFTLRISSLFNTNTSIWGQSLGPIHGGLSIRLFNKVLKDLSYIVLREDECVKQYSYIKIPENKLLLGYDLAFHLPEYLKIDIKKDKKDKTIAFTIKPFVIKHQNNKYKSILKDFIEYIISNTEYNVVLFPHVTIGYDIIMAKEIYNSINKKCKERVIFLDKEYSIIDTIKFYNNISLLIGTRLHSAIFSYSVFTPSINIPYHGTKSIGIFKSLGLEKFLFDINKDDLPYFIELFNVLINSDYNNLRYFKMYNKISERNFEIADIVLSK